MDSKERAQEWAADWIDDYEWREALKSLAAEFDAVAEAARRDERERCAGVCLKFGKEALRGHSDLSLFGQFVGGGRVMNITARGCAAAIRGQGDG